MQKVSVVLFFSHFVLYSLCQMLVSRAAAVAPSVLRQSALRQGAALVRHQPRRGKAISNWKRPTMEELPVPSEPWAQVNARENKRYNMQLAVGTLFLAGTVVFGLASGHIFLNLTPYHLMKKEK